MDTDQSGREPFIYRVQTAEPRPGRWRIRGHYSERYEAERAVAGYEQSGEKANITVLDPADPLERDAICHSLNIALRTGPLSEHMTTTNDGWVVPITLSPEERDEVLRWADAAGIEVGFAPPPPGSKGIALRTLRAVQIAKAVEREG